MGLILILILLIYGFLGFNGHEFVAGVSGVSRKQQFGYVLRGGGSSRWLQRLFGYWVFVFIWVLGYIILLCKNIILMSRIGK